MAKLEKNHKSREARERLSIRNPLHWLATGFGSGLAPVAPGTFGTLAAIPFYWFLADLPISIFCAIIVIASIAGIWICNSATKAIGQPDHGSIVWDEFVGIWITLIFLPNTWLWLLLGFVVFRLLDIAKPWPISVLDRNVGGGFGIMIDDILAGVIAAGVLYAAWFFTL